MPWFLNPKIYSELPVYQNPELYLFIIKLAVTVIFAGMIWRKGGTGFRRLLGITCVFFYGTFITVMLLTHNIVILGLHIFERSGGTDSAYNFHFYSLLLLGSILIFQGAKSLGAAVMLKNGNENADKTALKSTLIVLAVVVPLIPIQFFGTVITVMSLVNLAAIKLLLNRRKVFFPVPIGEKTPARAELIQAP
jgi:hypothetical protein